MSEKSKNEMVKKPVFGRLSFFLLWVVMSIGSASLFMPVYEFISGLIQRISTAFYAIGIPFALPGTLVSALVFAILTAPIEKILLRLGFGKWVKGWISASLLGAVLSFLFSIYINQNFYTYVMFNPVRFNLYLLVWSAFLVAPQAWLMRRYGKRAWIFFLIASIGNFLTNTVAQQVAMMGINNGSIAIGIGAAVMALNLLWLFRQEPSEEKAKQDVDASRLEEKTMDEDSLEVSGLDGLNYTSEEG